MKWLKQQESLKVSGYEDYLPKLKEYNKISFSELTEDCKEKVIEDIFNIYRGVGLLPIQYFSDKGIQYEIKKCVEKEVTFDGYTLNLKFNQGSSVCRFIFKNLHDIEVAGDKRTILKKFNDDHMLKRAIKFCLMHKTSNYPCTPSGIKDGLEMLGGNVATNFKPMNAKALYEKYTPVNGTIFDFACGFGGRMLGALSSKNNYTYMGVEPNTETFKYLQELGNHIEQFTGRSNSYKISCKGSEDLCLRKEGFVDFAFSSPPYFSLEKYSDEDTQCYNKFPELESWFEGYVRPTIENLYTMLKVGGYYAVNIADFKTGTKLVKFVDRWCELSEEVGFTFDKCIDMKLQTRRGDGHEENTRSKKEGIFVFKKIN